MNHNTLPIIFSYVTNKKPLFFICKSWNQIISQIYKPTYDHLVKSIKYDKIEALKYILRTTSKYYYPECLNVALRFKKLEAFRLIIESEQYEPDVFISFAIEYLFSHLEQDLHPKFIKLLIDNPKTKNINHLKNKIKNLKIFLILI